MASEASVANMAAVLMGSEARITSLSDDRTVARTLKAVWDLERRATIRDGSWNFAAARGTLAQNVVADATTIYPYSASFALPATAIRLIEVLDSLARDDFQIEGRNVICNATGPLYARWLIDVPEPADWPDQFASAFAHRLAWKCGRKIVGSDFGADRAAQEYQAALMMAKGTDAKENPPIDQEESDWVTARFTRSPYGGR